MSGTIDQTETKHLILIGPMVVGKTTVGLQLASRISREFFDSDSAYRTGRPRDYYS